MASARGQRTVHAPAARRELDGVRQQVPHHLLESIGIAGTGPAGLDCDVEARPLAVRGRRAPFEAASTTARQIDRLQVEPQLAGDDARHVEDVVDQLLLRSRVALDRLQGAPRRRALETPARAAAWSTRASR